MKFASFCKAFLKVIVLVILVVVFCLFYFIEETEEFMKQSTTFSSRNEEVSSFDVPDLMICFDPAIKLSMALKHNYPPDDPSFLVRDKNQRFLNPNLEMWDMFQELTYQFDRDYELNFTLNHKGFASDSKLKPSKVKNIATKNHGNCVLVQFDQQVLVSTLWSMNLTFKESLQNSDVPKKLKVLFVSNYTWYGLILKDWPYENLQLMEYNIEFNINKRQVFALSEVETQNIPKSKVNMDSCMNNLLTGLTCPRKCFPIMFNYIPNLQPCSTYAEVWCILSEIWGDKKTEYYKCLKPQKAKTYKATLDRYHQTKPIKNLMRFTFYYGSNIKQIYEEVYVISPTSFIGSVGGSLGLFFGFSFLGLCYDILSKLFHKLCTNF